MSGSPSSTLLPRHHLLITSLTHFPLPRLPRPGGPGRVRGLWRHALQCVRPPGQHSPGGIHPRPQVGGRMLMRVCLLRGSGWRLDGPSVDCQPKPTSLQTRPPARPHACVPARPLRLSPSPLPSHPPLSYNPPCPSGTSTSTRWCASTAWSRGAPGSTPSSSALCTTARAAARCWGPTSRPGTARSDSAPAPPARARGPSRWAAAVGLSSGWFLRKRGVRRWRGAPHS